MPESCLADLLGDLAPLSAEERAVLVRLEEREKSFRRGAAILRENDRLTEVFVLRRGTAMSYVLLDDGSRQIMAFHYSGDLLAMSALVYRHSSQSIVALTDCMVSPIERGAMAQVLLDQPRLAALILALTQIERVALTDRLAGVGRTSARSRVAALLLMVRDRLRALDPSIGQTFTLGLTQEEIGDATGLTAVHVNRMLRQLEASELIAREGGRVTLVKEPALIVEANYVNRYDGIDLGWLPPVD
ncbi:Crp/Fnr family transcriptional regulator [Sphingomonas bacterium]|uniref:Crp/Fnr family transcriptional regulator n=1 Tax=Sphingomonas bacterium TaxID=1895847 RepID=UPI0020C6C54C|nr:Crp/Fnr family transcriptional regulator [Sphingomonas bacterium]